MTVIKISLKTETLITALLIHVSGTSVGGNDVVATFDVGDLNHKVIHGLTLHSGHTYYATITGIYLPNS